MGKDFMQKNSLERLKREEEKRRVWTVFSFSIRRLFSVQEHPFFVPIDCDVGITIRIPASINLRYHVALDLVIPWLL
jgi:hypothetical protein